ncbi:hypothetical protein ACFQH6_13425 [Halobacteriaceae archaeon GCM10025711]
MNRWERGTGPHPVAWPTVARLSLLYLAVSLAYAVATSAVIMVRVAADGSLVTKDVPFDAAIGSLGPYEQFLLFVLTVVYLAVTFALVQVFRSRTLAD